jgi:hypothetical protein
MATIITATQLKRETPKKKAQKFTFIEHRVRETEQEQFDIICLDYLDLIIPVNEK